jgi:hypothetical protein
VTPYKMDFDLEKSIKADRLEPPVGSQPSRSHGKESKSQYSTLCVVAWKSDCDSAILISAHCNFGLCDSALTSSFCFEILMETSVLGIPANRTRNLLYIWSHRDFGSYWGSGMHGTWTGIGPGRQSPVWLTPPIRFQCIGGQRIRRMASSTASSWSVTC